jgi:Ser/Thr protein kinase RdoA (MazF antagonist)
VATDEQVRATLRAVWHVAPIDCVPIDDVPGSRWSVTIDEDRYIVRVGADAHRGDLIASLTVAGALAAAGVPIGEPVRTADGALTATTGIGEMALVHDVPGRPLDPADPLDQQWWGDLLGRAHAALRHTAATTHDRLALPASGPHLDVAGWLRPALLDVVAAVTRLTVTDQLTYGLLHGSPGPDSFRIDPGTGRVSLTAWGAPLHGQLVYDLAVAVRYAGGIERADELIDGYAASGPVGRDEIAVALPTMLRLHWALVADSHARALAATGSVVPLPRAAALSVAARRDELEHVRQVLTDLAHAQRAD